EATGRLRSRPAVLAALVSILRDWAACRCRTGDRTGAEHLWKVVEGVEPDPWRPNLRQAMLKAHPKAGLALATAPDLPRRPATTLTELAQDLVWAGQVDVAIGVLLQARRQQPTDFWVHYCLGGAFEKMGTSSLEQAVGCYRAAVALRPR